MRGNYFYVPDDTRWDRTKQCRTCKYFFRCQIMQRYKMHCEGKGKYYKAVVNMRELIDGEEPEVLWDDQMHFSKLIIEDDASDNGPCTRSSYDVDCIIEEENKKHRRFIEETSVFEITEEEYPADEPPRISYFSSEYLKKIWNDAISEL